MVNVFELSKNFPKSFVRQATSFLSFSIIVDSSYWLESDYHLEYGFYFPELHLISLTQCFKKQMFYIFLYTFCTEEKSYDSSKEGHDRAYILHHLMKH